MSGDKDSQEVDPPVTNGGGDVEGSQEHIPYPKSVFFIITNEFCERFSYYGMRTILVIYLNYMLHYSTDSATVMYHVFNMLSYFFPVLGAIIADSWLGKYKTILYLSIIYAIGNVVVAVTAVGSLNLPQSELTILGLLLISLGTGGIKPCVSAFGGDQFVIPQQELQLQRFFSVFYFAINAGSFISTFLTPVLREDVHCDGESSCFSLAFGVPAVLMGVSILSFVIGSRWYKIKAPEGNIVVECFKCMWHAVTKKEKGVKKEHWLDHAEPRFGKQFVDDLKDTLKVLVLYIPLPIFWALFDQQGSRWTFQATRMSGQLGSITIKPDQMQVVNPILILAFIPLFETVVYPVLYKFNLLKKPLQKMLVGGLLAALAFGVSAAVEFSIAETYPVLPVEGEAQVRFYNVLPCDIRVKYQDNIVPVVVPSLGIYEEKHLPVTKPETNYDLTYELCDGTNLTFKATYYEEEATSFTFYDPISEPRVGRAEDFDKSDNADPKLMVLYNDWVSIDKPTTVEFFDSDGVVEYSGVFNSTSVVEEFNKTAIGTYTVKANGVDVIGSFIFEQGGNYIVLIGRNETAVAGKSVQVTEPNSVNMMWLIPQYVIITAGEVLFSIPGLEFSFTQAPNSMKSVMTSMWLLAVAFGNLIVIIVAEAKFFDNQAYEFLLFAGLMILDMIVFAIMAFRYKYVDAKRADNKEEMELNANEISEKDKDF